MLRCRQRRGSAGDLELHLGPVRDPAQLTRDVGEEFEALRRRNASVRHTFVRPHHNERRPLQQEFAGGEGVATPHELGPVALALIKRNVPVDARLMADTTAAAQETVVEP